MEMRLGSQSAKATERSGRNSFKHNIPNRPGATHWILLHTYHCCSLDCSCHSIYIYITKDMRQYMYTMLPYRQVYKYSHNFPCSYLQLSSLHFLASADFQMHSVILLTAIEQQTL